MAIGETVCVVISWLKHIFPLCVDIAPFAVSVIFYVCQPIDKHTSLFATRIKQPMLVNIDKSLPCKYFSFLLMSKVDSFGQDFMAVNFTAVKFLYKSTTFFSHERKNIKKSRRKHPVDASDSEAEK